MVQEEPRNQVAISTHPLRSAGRRGGGVRKRAVAPTAKHMPCLCWSVADWPATSTVRTVAHSALGGASS